MSPLAAGGCRPSLVFLGLQMDHLDVCLSLHVDIPVSGSKSLRFIRTLVFLD